MHGSTPAAWTAVVISLIGFTIAGVGVVIAMNWVLFIVGFVLVFASPLVGKVMSAAGLGAKTSH